MAHEASTTTAPADLEEPRLNVSVQACCLSVMVAAICAVLGDPCAGTTGVAVLDSLPVFRITCIGFATFTFLGATLGSRCSRLRGSAEVAFRVAIIFNSLAFWWVTWEWCMDSYTWWCIFVLEHCFTMIFLMVFVRGMWMFPHLLFTLAGAFTGFCRPNDLEDAHPSHEEEEIWKTGVLIAVSVLVASLGVLLLLDIRTSGRLAGVPWLRKASGRAAAANATPGPQEEAWAGVVPADPASFMVETSSTSTRPTRPTRPTDGGSATEEQEWGSMEHPFSSSAVPTSMPRGTSGPGAQDHAFPSVSYVGAVPESEADTHLPDADHTLHIPVAVPWVAASETSSHVVRMPSMTSEYEQQPYTSEDVSTTGDCASILEGVSHTSSYVSRTSVYFSEAETR